MEEIYNKDIIHLAPSSNFGSGTKKKAKQGGDPLVTVVDKVRFLNVLQKTLKQISQKLNRNISEHSSNTVHFTLTHVSYL